MVILKSTDPNQIKKSLVEEAEMICYAKEVSNKPYTMCIHCNGYDKACRGYISKRFHNKINRNGADHILNI